METVARLPHQKLFSFFDRIWKIKKKFGLKNTFHYLTIDFLNRFFEFRIVHCISVKLENLPKKYLIPDPKYNYSFLDGETLKKYCLPEYELTEEFVAESLERGDKCFAIMENDNLASYGWYSTKQTDDSENLVLNFSGAVYMYKGFVIPTYRGKGLNATNRAQAMREYGKLGQDTLLSTIESNNFASLNSARRLGNKFFGKFLVIKLFGKYFTFRTKGCKKYDFSITPK